MSLGLPGIISGILVTPTDSVLSASLPKYDSPSYEKVSTLMGLESCLQRIEHVRFLILDLTCFDNAFWQICLSQIKRKYQQDIEKIFVVCDFSKQNTIAIKSQFSQFFHDVSLVNVSEAVTDKGKKLQTSLQTLTEANAYAAFASVILGNEERVQTSLQSVLQSAVIFGNLAMKKEQLLSMKASVNWQRKIDEMAMSYKNLEKKVDVSFYYEQGYAKFVVKDMGSGFVWKNYSNDKLSHRLTDVLGSKEKMKERCDKLTYEGKGNVAIAEFFMPRLRI